MAIYFLSIYLSVSATATCMYAHIVVVTFRPRSGGWRLGKAISGHLQSPFPSSQSRCDTTLPFPLFPYAKVSIKFLWMLSCRMIEIAQFSVLHHPK